MAKSLRQRPRTRSVPLGLRARLFLPGRSWRLQIFGIALAIAAAIVSAQSLASARESAATYLIQPGDSLLQIAGSTGVALDRLMALNGLKDPDMIIAGKTLQLQAAQQQDQAAATSAPAPAQTAAQTPAAPASSGAGAAKYTVKAGDTLWDIAVATKVTVDALIKANSLDNADRLTVGQQLSVPKPAPKPAPSAPASSAPGASAPASSAPAASQAQAAQKPSGLQQKLLAEAQRVGGPNARVGVAAYNLVSGERVAIKGDESFPSASVMKLPILVELERQIAAGTLKWNDALRNDVNLMISISDNDAANRLTDRVSMVAVNDEMRSLGLGSTRFLNTFTDTRSPINPGQNSTTPSNMARLLELIATDQIVNSATSADIRSQLARNTDRSKLARLLPGDAKLAHKSGWFDGVANDVGIVTVERVPARWVIAVFTQNVPDAETGNQLVAAISKAVYDQWAP